MSNDGESRKPSTWDSIRQQGQKTVARMIGALLKLLGVLHIIGGLLTFALANMDTNPTSSMLWGVLITCLGLLMLYLGIKVAQKANRM